MAKPKEKAQDTQKFVDFMVEKSQKIEQSKPYKSTDVDMGSVEEATKRLMKDAQEKAKKRKQ